MERVLMKGDLSTLTAQERVSYYSEVCKSVGLNPLTQPFQYITLNGKLTLYARKDCTDQLRMIHNVSVSDLTESEREGVFVVTAKVQNGSGRTDMAKGAVNIAGLKGEALANALMKAETKAKRRATLSICGLGMLDELEVEDIPAAAKRPNPHVTTPDDVSDAVVEYDEQGNPIDNIPLGDPSIEPLGRAKIRKDFEAALLEMRATVTLRQLETWGKANANRVQSYPPNDAEIFRKLYAEHRDELRAAMVPDLNPLQAG
jgi:hypothetical protein